MIENRDGTFTDEATGKSYGSRPKAFTGDPQELRDAPHHWSSDPDDPECYDCGCKPGSVSAGWPCGADIPREPWL